jgi:hypothetical protein
VDEVRRVAEDRRRTATGAWSARRRARDAGHHGDDVPVRRSPGACVDDRLAEFEQRDPAAFGRWPPTAGTGGDPARFFRHGPSWRSTGDAAW